jgi:hypothetical protein
MTLMATLASFEHGFNFVGMAYRAIYLTGPVQPGQPFA